MERRTFEDSLKDVFKDAEATPSDKVWTNVELELEKETGSSMRRRLAFYQMLAAAAVTLALLSSGVAYFIVSNRNQTIEQLVAASNSRGANSNDQAMGPVTESAQLIPDNTQSSTESAGLAKAEKNSSIASENPAIAQGGNGNDSDFSNNQVASAEGQTETNNARLQTTSGATDAPATVLEKENSRSDGKLTSLSYRAVTCVLYTDHSPAFSAKG